MEQTGFVTNTRSNCFAVKRKETTYIYTSLSSRNQTLKGMDFNGKVVLITGASSGIGEACAILFAKSNAKLSLVGRNEEKLKITAKQCEQLNNQESLTIIADISKDEDVKRIIDKTIAHFGRLDVLVNNAGMSLFSSTTNGIEVFDAISSTNLRGTFNLTSKAIPHLIQSKGNVVNISSILSSKPNPRLTVYCMTKAAIDMFTKCLALELGDKGVRVNSVNPGAVKTEIFKRAGVPEDRHEQFFETLETASALKKITGVNDVAEVVAFLASDKAQCVTGSCYIIDCGMIIFEKH